MVAPATRDIEIYRGDGFRHQIEFVDLTLTAIDMSGRTWLAQWRPYRDAPDDQAIDFAVDTTDAIDGIVVLTLTGLQTSTLPLRGEWDIQATLVGGEPQTLLEGDARVRLDVSR